MRNLLHVCFFLSVQNLAPALEISVGATKLEIPAPAGFLAVTDEMKPYADLSKRFVPASNEQFCLFLPSEAVALAMKGDIPTAERRLYIQTTKELVTPFVLISDFNEVKHLIKQQNEEIVRKAEASMPGVMKKLSEGITNDYNLDIDLTLTQMLPLPPHTETDRSLAYSMFMKYNLTDSTGAPTVFEGVVTTTFAYIQGKILFLYVCGGKKDLEWTRMESRKWAESIVSANPSTGSIASREKQQTRGFDWSKVGEKTLIGAIIGSIVGLLGYLLKAKTGK